MTDIDGRFGVAVGLAAIAGILHGIEPGIPLLARTPDLEGVFSPTEIGPILSVVNVLSMLITISIFLAGYWWASRADIPGAYGRFTVVLAVAAFIGHSLGFLPLFLLISNQPVIASLGLYGVLSMSVLAVPVPGLAGGAISQYRTVTHA